MADGLTTAALSEGIRRIAAGIEVCADELNRLDGDLGDGDLGVTLSRGTQGMLADLPNMPEDVGLALMRCAQVFTRVSGSTFGTLVATALMSAAKTTRGRTEVPWGEVSTLLADAISEMSRRGKASLGDKTVLDALDAARQAAEGLDDPSAIGAAAKSAISEKIDSMRSLRARQGRARIFADRSVGLDDPGMVAVLRLVESLQS